MLQVLTEYVLVSVTSAVTVTIAGVVKEAVTILVKLFSRYVLQLTLAKHWPIYALSLSFIRTMFATPTFLSILLENWIYKQY